MQLSQFRIVIVKMNWIATIQHKSSGRAASTFLALVLLLNATGLGAAGLGIDEALASAFQQASISCHEAQNSDDAPEGPMTCYTCCAQCVSPIPMTECDLTVDFSPAATLPSVGVGLVTNYTSPLFKPPRA